jgi:predicted Co/Zn/Cd cation transporter (cation efflux family)
MVADLTRSYVNFATDDGNRHDFGTAVMVAGPVMIALLAMYFVYNVIAAVVSGGRTVGGFVWRQFQPVRTAPVVTLPAAAELDTATIYIAASVAA